MATASDVRLSFPPWTAPRAAPPTAASSIPTSTSTPDRDGIFAGAGLSAQFGQNWNAYFYYNANFARQDYLSHAISAGLEWKF